MLPLIPLAATLVPELIRLIAGDKAGTVATSAARAVLELTGTTDPVTARQRLEADPAAAASLRQRLAEIALDASKAQYAEAAQQRQDELTAIKLTDRNTAGARTTMQSLAGAGSPMAWGAPVVSAIVTGGFFVILGLLMLNGLGARDDKAFDIINIAIGVLGTGFATVVNFWLGSSSGSRNKEAQVIDLQAGHAAQTAEFLRTLQKAHDSQADSARAALATVTTVAAPASNAATAAGSETAPVPAQDNFNRCVAVTLAQEGGFVQAAADPGGATNFGITLATLHAWRGSAVSSDDVRALTRSEAIEIYRANYWLPARCGELPAGVDLMVFDCGVHSGPRLSVKLLQKAAGVTDDGSLGPNTLAAVKAATDMAGLINHLAEARLAYCRSLDTYAAFGAGWTNRIRQVTAAALAMA